MSAPPKTVFSLMLFGKHAESKTVILSEAQDLTNWGFFSRGTVREYFHFASRSLATVVAPGGRESVRYRNEQLDQAFLVHCACRSGEPPLAGVVITVDDYNPRVALGVLHRALQQLMTEFTDTVGAHVADTNLEVGLRALLNDAQQPERVDNLAKIQADLDDTKEVLIKSIDQLLVRGQKLEDLAQASDDLCSHTKAFLKQSKDLNRCCVIV